MEITAPLFRAAGQGVAPPVDIVQIRPDGFPDSGVFTEVSETLVQGFRTLGYDAALKFNAVRPGVPTIVLAAHLMRAKDAIVLPVGAIIYNLEQIRPGAWAANEDYLKILRRHTVWDFDAKNVEAIAAATGNLDVHHVPIGFVRELERIAPAAEQDIDVLFYGSITPRRKKLFDAFASAGVKLHAVFRVYGAERDALIARSKVVLCPHAHDNWSFEIVRVSYLLANKKAVVCEAASAAEIDDDLREGLSCTPYDGLIKACAHLVRDDGARRALEAKGYEAFQRRPEAEFLRKALTAPARQQSSPAHFSVGAHVDIAHIRNQYLDLLAKTLTNQIYGDPPIGHRPGSGFNAQTRSLGRDWPSQAMTMIGDKRLHNIRELVEIILASGIAGDLIETGVWRGGACIFMRAILNAHGANNRKVWVADSFAGLPPPDPKHPRDANDKHHTIEVLSVGYEEVRENFRKFGLLDDQVVFLRGWFSQTLPVAPIEKLALLRLDGDMYGSTMDALNALYQKVSPGGFVIVDDYGAVAGCRAAITDFRQAHKITAPIQDIDGLGVFWRVPA